MINKTVKCKCPECGFSLSHTRDYKIIILSELSKGILSPIQLKNELGCNSLGTILYHLNILEKEGLVIKIKYYNVVGKPTFYFLKDNIITHKTKLGEKTNGK